MLPLEQPQPGKAAEHREENEVAEATEPDDRGINTNQVEKIFLLRGDKIRVAVLPNLDEVNRGFYRRGFLINNPGGHVHPDDRHRQQGDKAESGKRGEDGEIGVLHLMNR